MFRRSKKDPKGQTVPSGKGRTTAIDADHFFRLLRKLSERMTEVESKVSTLRRDLNRIDRRLYRSDVPSPQEQVPSQPETLEDQINKVITLKGG